MLHRILNFAAKHKIIVFLAIVAIIGGGYFSQKKFKSGETSTSYILSSAERGAIIVSVEGTGQVSVLKETSVKSEVSADVIYLGAKEGDGVKIGQILAKLDTTEAEEAVDVAEENLEDAQSALDEILGYETAYGHIRGTKEKAEDALDTTYEDGFNATEDAFLDLPSLMTGFYSVLFSNSFSANQSNIDYYANAAGTYNETALKYRDDAYEKYQTAKTMYDQNLEDYKSASRDDGAEKIEGLINESYDTIKAISEAAKSANNLIQFYQEKTKERGLTPATLSDTHLTSAQGYMSKTSSYLSSLLSAKNTIKSSKESLIEIDENVADAKKQIEDMEEKLKEAEEELDNYLIYAPASGIIMSLNAEEGDSISKGGTIMIIAAEQKIAEITLNEVDVANLKIDQKANLTFDAIEDLNIAGTVSKVDAEGAVSQGVVSYVVTINFDTQNDQVKSGMTVSAAIITEARQNVLAVPSSALKSSPGKYYVETLSDSDILSGENSTGVISKNLPSQKEVTVGLSDDTLTEILSGLEEGSLVITKTITSGSSNSSKSSSGAPSSGGGSLLQTISGSGGGSSSGGMPRF